MTDPASSDRLIRRVFHEGTNVPNSRETLLTIFRSDFICHGPPGMNHSHDDGPQPIENCIFGGAFADLVFTVGDVDIDDDGRVVTHFSATGNHVADFHGVSPSGEARTVLGTATFRLDDGMLAEGWGTLAWS